MRGNRDSSFLESINDAFICLITTAINHCLREWTSGKVTDDLLDFNYENARRELLEYAMIVRCEV